MKLKSNYVDLLLSLIDLIDVATSDWDGLLSWLLAIAAVLGVLNALYNVLKSKDEGK